MNNDFMSNNEYLAFDKETETFGSYTIKATSPNMPPLYSSLDDMLFQIEVKESDKFLPEGTLDYEFFWDQDQSVKKGSLELTGEAIEIPFKAETPGFVTLKVTLIVGEEKFSKSCGAGFAVEKLLPALGMPDDFHDFWNKKLEELSEAPMEVTHQVIDYKSHPQLHDYSHKSLLQEDITGVDISYTRITALGAPVEGILVQPSTRKKGQHPLILAVQGAGVFPTQPHNFIKDVRKGAIVLEINAHGILNDQPKSYYTELSQGRLKDYPKQEFQSRDDFYFLGMFLRVKRALEYLKSLPEWDGKNLCIYGNSQGGAQTMAGVYLDPDVSIFSAFVPSFCAHSAALSHRQPGGPRFVPYRNGVEPDLEKIEMLRYFDAANFLKCRKADGLFAIGYLDGGCRPATIYVAYNSHIGPHKMIHQPYSGHSILESTEKARDEFVWNHFNSNR